MPTDSKNNIDNRQRGHIFWQQLTEKSIPPDAIVHRQDDLCHAFSCSTFLAETVIANPDWLQDIVSPSDSSVIDVKPLTFYQDALSTELQRVTNEDSLLKALRQFRNKHMAAITYRDVLNQQSIETSLSQVSALADTLINGAYHWLFDMLSEKHGTPHSNGVTMPMYILGMGKLGGKELNFSSDIDLIFAYPEKGETQGGRKPLEHQQFFTRLAQKLIQALNKITTDGQVYRVDMRLRPFGESGPLVMHFSAFEDYYQEQGRHWERFAMIKARIINDDDSDSAKALSAILQPFTFRRYLDFTTIDALRNMKKLIATEIRRRRLNNNIKLGAGGIREVEFFAQSFQLIHGGREPLLQSKSLLTTLSSLSKLDIVESDVTKQLASDYLFLRKIEHTLQQCRDKQTQTLPDNEWEQHALCMVLGYENYDALLREIDHVMNRIHSHFNELVEEQADTHDEHDTLFETCRDAWQLALDKGEFVDTFAPTLCQEDAEHVFMLLSDFKGSQRHYRMGQRGEDTLNKLMPEILYALISHNPTTVQQLLKRILGVITAITGRTTYLDLLLENPDVLKQLVKLCDRSEWIANEIKRFPLLLDELLSPLYLQQQNTDIASSKLAYKQELRETMLRIELDDVERIMDMLRQYKLCQQLRIAASDISGSLPISNVSDKLTVLAEVVLEHAVNAAWFQMIDRYGIPSHLAENSDVQTQNEEGLQKGFAVIGYGKLGGYELGYGSDLDLVFLHNAPRDAVTTGKKSIEAQQFYIKLSQRIMHLLNTKTLFGQLYETDLRLRPSGNSGLLCCHIDGFEKYQQQEAWTWEHQALVRARAVYGDASLLSAFNTVRHTILSAARNNDALADDVCKMREKMRTHLLTEHGDKVDLKQCVGGITDIEFMTQYWVLANANDINEITHYTDNLRILDMAAEAGIIASTQATELQQAYLALREQYHHLTLADTKYADDSTHLEAMRSTVSRYWNALFVK